MKTIRTIAIAAIATWALTSSPAKADEQLASEELAGEQLAGINCQAQPGATLCRDIRVAYSYLVNCTGGCDGLMYDQTRSFNQLVNSYFTVYYPGVGVDQDMTSQAYTMATKLCAYQWRDAVNTGALNQWTIAANRVLNGLKDLQVAGGRSPARHCQFTVRTKP